MGKINIKQKAKNAAVKRKKKEEHETEKEQRQQPPQNPFELHHPPQPLNPSLPPTVEDFENKSVISFKALHGVAKSKKEKLKLRRKLWHEKIELCKEKSKKTKKNQPPARRILEGENGFRLLLDSLPSVKDRVSELKGIQTVAARHQTSSATAAEVGQRPKRKTEKQRRREDLRNVETFNRVLKHPEFQKSPMDTMLEHLKNKQELEKNGLLVEEEVGVPKRKSRNRRRKREGKNVEEKE